ncbi:DEAD/DEAH box helicase [bacterium]|nr:DEAD/DEAH box helicase [bacterium]
MVSVSSENKPKLLQYLKRLAPFSAVDKGISFAVDGRVVECSKVNSTITAMVRAPQGGDPFHALPSGQQESSDDYSVTLEVVSSNRVEAHCRCSSREEMEEQWCVHSVAVLWRASDLGFFEPHSGFASNDSAFRINTSGPDEIAAVLEKVSEAEPLPGTSDLNLFTDPKVTVLVTPSGDRFGIQVLFNDELQEPHFFESYSPRSSRTLDNLLIQLLEDSGSWDESGKMWFVNSSQHISSLLGLVDEFDEVKNGSTGEDLHLHDEALEAHLSLTWSDTTAEISFRWNLPDGTIEEGDGELIGTGPYWALLENTVYPVTSNASKLASLFPHAPRITVPKGKIGPVLEHVARSEGNDSSHLVIANPERTPKTAVKAPKPLLELWGEDQRDKHFSSGESLTLEATLDFRYPTAKNQETVYLPHHEKEQEHRAHLESLGFSYNSERRRYFIHGDNALDLVEKGEELFPSPWKIEGIDAIQQQIRFAELNLNVSVEKTEESMGPVDWFNCKISLSQNNANVPLSTLFRLVKKGGDRWIRLDSGAYAKVPAGGIGRLQATLGFLDPNYRLSNTIKTKLQPSQALGLIHAEDERMHISADKTFQQLSRKLKSFSRIEAVAQPKNFRGKLRTYQNDGISWMNFLHRYELGGILADEMGLGKTVQTLAFLQYLKEGRSELRELRQPVLIVAPTSVIMNWKYEAERFTPQLKTLVLHGSKRKELFPAIREHDIVITSYALLRIDKPALQEFEFSYVVLDEAQNIKNPSAATTRAAKSLKAHHRLALTGTPTENRPLELWSIFDFLMPGYLGSAEFFRNHLEKPILEGQDSGQRASELLSRKTAPFIMRRLKNEVEKDLPRKTETELHVPMTPAQADLYRQILDEVRPQVFEAVEERGVRGAGVSILAALLRLRQVCNHPYSIPELQSIEGLDSGKYELFQEVVREAIQSGRKLLIFSQFREMLRLLREFLEREEISHLYLDGATKDRQPLVDTFNTDESVRAFLISLKAGGTGLNLTAADTVVIYDPWWNPAVESQAVDRAHRIGQRKSVTVYRFVTEDSIEQKIMKLKMKKKKITEALIQEGENASPLQLSKAELEDLFQMPTLPEE